MFIKIVVTIFLIVIVFTGCKPTRPSWWKEQGTVMNWGQVQTTGGPGNHRFTVPMPRFCGCPVMWSNGRHKTYTDSRIIFGVGPGFVSVLPLQGMVDKRGTLTNALSQCPTIPADGNAPSYIYLTTSNNELRAYADDFEHPRWIKQLSEFGESAGSPNVWGDLIFVPSRDGFLHVRGVNGDLKWDYKLGGTVSLDAPPISIQSADNAVYVSNIEGDVAKMGAEPIMKLYWKKHFTPPGVSIVGNLMIDSNSDIYIPCSDGVLRVITPDGNLDWVFGEPGNTNLTGPALSFDGKDVYIASEEGHFWAVNIQSHTADWTTTLPGKPTTAPLVSDDEAIHFGISSSSLGSAIIAFNKNSLLWQYNTNLASAPSYLAMGEDGTVYATTVSQLVAIK